MARDRGRGKKEVVAVASGWIPVSCSAREDDPLAITKQSEILPWP